MPESKPKISIIIPCLDDAKALEGCLERLNFAVEQLDVAVEVIVADASSGDESKNLAEGRGAKVVHCEGRGRGFQLNDGARVATGRLLVFNHADTELTGDHLLSALRAIDGTAAAVGGAFYRDLEWQYSRLGWLSPLVRAYTRQFGILYGDQSVFVRHDVFKAMDGFASIPIMEDVDFSRRLRKQGSIVLLDPPLRTSMRRFRKRGYLRNKIQNLAIIWLWRLGVMSPEKIYRWYYGKSAEGSN